MKQEDKLYDFIVIGSGMGGLVCANILAKSGFSVLVLEKNQQIGGSLQIFSRDKCIFDTGVHYIGSLDQGEYLDRVFSYLGIMEKLELKKLDENQFDSIRFSGNKSFPLGQGYKKFSQQLIEAFPQEEDGIKSFCKKVKEICTYFPLYNLKGPSEKNYLNDPGVLELDAWDYISSITTNQELRAVLLGNGPLYAGERHITPFYVVALITNSYIKGSYKIVNGGGQLTKALLSKLRENGGDLLKRQNVISAEYNENKILSVLTDKSAKFQAKNFISNAHPLATIKIFGKEKFRPAYRRRIEKLKNTISSFSVYISLKENSFKYFNYNIYDYFVAIDKVWDVTNYDKNTWPQVMFTCTPIKKGQNEFADSLSVLAYMNFDEVSKWKETNNTVACVGDRGKEYEQFKKRKEEQVIARLEERFPNIRSLIKNVYSSTPLTYKDYIGTEDGSLYGIKKDVNNSTASIINSRTKIPNLYLTGQNIVFHGILGTTIGAMVTCFNFVDQEKLISDINTKYDEQI